MGHLRDYDRRAPGFWTGVVFGNELFGQAVPIIRGEDGRRSFVVDCVPYTEKEPGALPNGETLISGTGALPGTEPGCPADGGGCADNRVIIVDDATNTIVWQYGASGRASGSGPDHLDAPVAAVLLLATSGAHLLITDQGNNRVIEVDRATKGVVWQYPPAHATTEQMLNGPNSAERLANGHTLIADEGGNRVVEVTSEGDIVWQYPAVLDVASLDAPAFASRLACSAAFCALLCIFSVILAICSATSL